MRWLIPTLAIILVPSCVHIPDPEEEAKLDFDLPELWGNASEGQEKAISSGWLATFHDAEMTALVNEALKNNRNLRITASRLRSAKESLITSRANRLPSLNWSGSGSRSGSRSRDDSGDLGPWRRSEGYGLSFGISWEADLWGRLRDLEEATYQDYLVALADFRAARLSLAANTAKAWCNLITAGQQYKLALSTRESFQTNLQITERLYRGVGDGGGATALDVQFRRNNLASAERSVSSSKLGRDEAARSLEILLGRYPGAAVQERETLPDFPDSIPVGLPSQLLERRPDLVASAALVSASAKRADASRKSLLPDFRLSGSGSTSSADLLKLIAEPESIAWSIAASLGQTLYRGGALEASARQALENNRRAIESYSDTALRAYREVESAIAREKSLAEQETFLEEELKQANRAEASAQRDFIEGLVTILSILESERRAVNARNSIILLRNQRIQNRIDLFLALGGDFETLAETDQG